MPVSNLDLSLLQSFESVKIPYNFWSSGGPKLAI